MDNEFKINKIKKWLFNRGYKYIDIPQDSVDAIYDCLILDKQEETVSGIVAHYYGVYYGKTNDIEKMVKYYMIGVELGIWGSMHNLGSYYYRIGDNSNMEKYYKMSIETGNGHSMDVLFRHYREMGRYTTAIEYCLTLIERNMTDSYIHMRDLLTGQKLTESHYIKLIDITDYRTYSIIVEGNTALLLLYKLYKIKTDPIETALKFSPDWEGLKLAKEDFAEQVINMENLKN